MPHGGPLCNIVFIMNDCALFGEHRLGACNMQIRGNWVETRPAPSSTEVKGLPGDLQPLTLQAARVTAGSLHTAPGEGLLGGQACHSMQQGK